MNKCKKCGREIKGGDICNGCAVADGFAAMLEMLKRKPLPGVMVKETDHNCNNRPAGRDIMNASSRH